MKKIVLTFGLIAGGIMAAMFLIMLPFHDRIGLDTAMIIGYASMIAAFLLIYFGVRTYRDNVAGGTISFWQAFKVGMLIVFVASTVYVATWEVLYTRIGDDYAAWYIDRQMAEARADGLQGQALEERRQKLVKDFELYDNLAVNIAWTYLEPLPPGLLMCLISARLLRRRREDEVQSAAPAPVQSGA